MLRVTKPESGKARGCRSPRKGWNRGRAGRAPGSNRLYKTEGRVHGCSACVHIGEQAYSAGMCGCRHTNTWRTGRWTATQKAVPLGDKVEIRVQQA